MRRVWLYITFLTILSTAFSASISATDKPDIVEPNHFFSESKTEKLYNLGSLQKDKPIAIVLKSSNPADTTYNNKISINVAVGSKKQDCNFQSMHDLCTLDSIPEQKGTLLIKCEKTPCDVTWKVIQPDIKELKDSQHIQKFYKVSSNDPRKMHLNIICSSIQIKDVSSLFSVYSDLEYIRFDNELKSYVLFQQPKEGHIYFQMKKQFSSCAAIKIDRVPATISNEITSDLLVNGKITSFQLDDLPDNDFRLDIGLYVVAPSLQANNQLTIRITGEKDNSRSTIRENVITIPSASKSFDLSYAIPRIEDWKSIQLSFETNIAGVLLDFNSATDSQQLVEAYEISYFDLKKGQKLSYKLVPEEKASEKTIKINPFDSQKIKISKEQCSVKTGCDFEVEAIEDARGFIFLGTGDDKVFASEQPIILQMGSENSFTKKMREGEKIYLKKDIEKDKGFQVLINTINIIVYMSTNKKCQLPSHECYNEIGTLQRHFVFLPHEQDQKFAIFMVEALDNCEFTLSLIYEEGSVIRLEDSKPFAYLFDSTENQLKFSFTRSSKTDVSFNLVGPFHALDLIVDNSKKMPTNYEDCEISSEGFLEFLAKDNKNDDFSIIVRKRESHKQSFVHFLLIASTVGKQVRLETGMTYYETLSKNQKQAKRQSNAQYIFQFNIKEDYVLNFYSHNMREEKVEIKLLLSASNDNWDSKDKTKDMTIDQTSDVLDLSEVSDSLCVNSGQGDSNCELFMRLLNPTNQQIDIAITLLTRGAILQMHSGVWQSYNLNTVAKSAHFYFQPKKKDSDVNIYFKTSDPSLRLSYRLYSGAGDTLNPLDWPFPSIPGLQQKSLHKQYRPVKHMSISSKELAQCFPYCIVLMSIIELEKNHIEGNFSLMASDSITEIPQKQKFDIVISAEQEKVYLVDLKYAIDQDKDIFFYSSTSMGMVNIYADVYSEKNDRIPDEDEHDFQLTHQTVIPIDKIKQILEDEGMDEHNDIYLYIIVMATSDSKISLEFGFDENDEQNAKLISFDTFDRVAMPAKSTQIFYSIVDQPFELKITRESGFPFLTTLICKQKLDKCIEDIKDEDNDGTQLLTKISANTATPCSTCYYFFKLTTKQDPATVELHLQSQTSEIELTESKTVYDFTEKDESNSYVLYAVRGQEIFVNVDVTQGEIEVQITDLHEINMKKTGKQLVSFNIPTQAKSNQNKYKEKQRKDHQSLLQQYKKDHLDETEETKKNLPKEFMKYLQKQRLFSESYLSAFGLSEKFIILHIRIKSADSSKQSIYTLSYSSGEIEFDLQDGLITEYQLEGDKESTFYYSSKQRGHAYLMISTQKTSEIVDLSVSLKYCEPKDNIVDEDCWVEFKTDKPPIKDKTPNPTIMYSLPSFNYFAITLNYEGSKSTKVTLGINHQQVILLPLEKQFPFVLHHKENISMLAQISNPGYIYATVRKCDSSSPTFAYTFDYDSFQDDDFNYETTLNENPKAEFFSKVTPGTMYLKFSSPEDTSLLSVYIKFSEKKTKQTSMAPGGRGQLQYSIIDSKTAQLAFKPPVCSDGSCSSKIKYHLMTATLRRDLYSQLVCPSNYFSTYEAVSKDPIAEQQLTPKENSDGSLSLTFQLVDQISYVGIRATDSKSHEVFYQPIQVATLWGQLSRTSHVHKWSIFSIVIFCLLSLVIFVRRKSREGYKPIEQEY